MVRVGGLDYVCDPTAKMGSRISNMTLDNGTPVEASKKYVVAGWASVADTPPPGAPVWDQVADYLRVKRTVKIEKLNTPKLVNVKGNPGLEDYAKS
jgi:sulfur-oxidizing protein SoxB